MKVTDILSEVDGLKYPQTIKAHQFKSEVVRPAIAAMMKQPVRDLETYVLFDHQVATLKSNLEAAYPVQAWGRTPEEAGNAVLPGYAALLGLPILSLVLLALRYRKTALLSFILAPTTFLWAINREQNAQKGLLVQQLKGKLSSS